jgi:hypothetical protein
MPGILTMLVLLVITSSAAMAADDWAYELPVEAKKIYRNKRIQYPCKNIPALLRQSMPHDRKQSGDGLMHVPVQNEKTDAIYFTIRDAGLFQTKSCDAFIQKHRDRLRELPGVKAAIAFYYYRLGDKRQLDRLAADFDSAAGGGDCTVELFGFLDDWEVSGVRLVRLAAHADASGAALLCSSIMWRRYLNGEKAFKEHWYKIGAQEKIDRRRLDLFFETCGPRH